MSIINFHTKEIAVKIVYYGPGLCGKTTSLQTIYASLPPERKPQIVSLATEVDRTIFFDFLPVTAYRIRDFRVRLQLYTVPGQVFYNATRKLVLNGVDGLVFVADSQKAMKDSNLESLQNLEENLIELGLETEQVPLIMQFNKRDLQDIYTVDEMDKLYNSRGAPVFATVATSGEGLFDAMRAISQMVVNSLLRKGLGKQLGLAPQAPAPAPTPAPAPSGLSESIAAAAAASAPAPTPPAPAPVVAPPSATAPPSPAAPPSSSVAAAPGLWPGNDTTHLTQNLDRALQAGHWSETILAAEALVRHVASQGSGQPGSDTIPSFILLRGVASARYRSFVESLNAARSGQPVTRAQAMNALIVALESIW